MMDNNDMDEGLLMRDAMQVDPLWPELSMTRADLDACLKAFQKFDKDVSGSIDTRELTALLRSMGQNPTDSEVHEMINEVDVNGSGVVEFPEFVTFMARLMRNVDPEHEVREAFRRFDTRNEGLVRTEELRFVLQNLPVHLDPGEIQQIIDAGDNDKDGFITFEEFRIMLGQ